MAITNHERVGKALSLPENDQEIYSHSHTLLLVW